MQIIAIRLPAPTSKTPFPGKKPETREDDAAILGTVVTRGPPSALSFGGSLFSPGRVLWPDASVCPWDSFLQPHHTLTEVPQVSPGPVGSSQGAHLSGGLSTLPRMPFRAVSIFLIAARSPQA